MYNHIQNLLEQMDSPLRLRTLKFSWGPRTTWRVKSINIIEWRWTQAGYDNDVKEHDGDNGDDNWNYEIMMMIDDGDDGGNYDGDDNGDDDKEHDIVILAMMIVMMWWWWWL